ncbi:hypothetical protein [Parvicella tangerina]|uniref:Uncharacterized protein n=1 Tax=Parvicella tangerina TaxID=2829795 RepID=A0A916JHK2_9FLAO|nr:hypothetical protein [Parvicella tangerina]CAG5076256.1 hypothetical protein CRYO30217_00010 [Parvicella tangerina]
MKKLRLLTVSTLLLAGSMATFTSCGGGEEKDEKDKKEEKSSKDNGQALVKQMMDAFDNGDLEMNVSSADDVKKAMDIDSDDDDYISLDKEFKGYDFDANFTMEDGALASVSCNTFYDDDAEEAAEKDSKEVLEYLEGLLGKSESSSDTYFDWTYGDLEISFSIYDDGYSLYIDPASGSDIGSSEEGCVGDFYNLKKDLTDLFLTNVKNGSIELGSTTKSEMAAITGDETGFDKEYDGLRVSGYFSYNGDVLSSITLDYFYDCDGALSLLDMDKEDLTEEINTGLGVTGEKDGDYEDAATEWTINGMSVRQANFSDGYSIYFEK